MNCNKDKLGTDRLHSQNHYQSNGYSIVTVTMNHKMWWSVWRWCPDSIGGVLDIMH